GQINVSIVQPSSSKTPIYHADVIPSKRSSDCIAQTSYKRAKSSCQEISHGRFESVDRSKWREETPGHIVLLDSDDDESDAEDKSDPVIIILSDDEATCTDQPSTSSASVTASQKLNNRSNAEIHPGDTQPYYLTSTPKKSNKYELFRILDAGKSVDNEEGDGRMWIWNLQCGSKVHCTTQEKDANVISISHDDKYIALDPNDGLPHDGIMSLHWIPGSSLLMSGGNDNCVRIWDVNKCGKQNPLVYQFTNHDSPVTSVRLSPDLSLMTVGVSTGKIYVYSSNDSFIQAGNRLKYL
ncbi:3043_t:CDS:2, partial [Racocetra fulgida]